MTTVVNNPAVDTGGSSLLIGVIVLMGFIMIFLYFGIPAIRRIGSAQLSVPPLQVVMPEKLDVNVTQTK